MKTPTESRTVISDPRLHARWREVRRQDGRRRLRRLKLAVATSVVVGSAWGLARSPVLDVDQLQVLGADRTGFDAVLAASGITNGDAMAWLDLDGARVAVEALPWVDTAAIVRHWPARVSVSVIEREPVAVAVAGSGSLVVLDEDGRQLDVVTANGFERLPRVRGLAVSADGLALDDSAQPVLALTRLLPDALGAAGVRLLVDDGEVEVSLVATTGDDIVVRFGRPTELAAKVDALRALVQSGILVDVPPPTIVDVRVPSAPVLTRSEG